MKYDLHLDECAIHQHQVSITLRYYAKGDDRGKGRIVIQ